MSDNKKTFVADKIRTSEICGIDGDLLIHSTSSQTISSISGNYITGQHLGISGESVHISGAEMVITDNGGDGVIDLKSGEFDHLVVDGVKYIPKEHLVYAFRFGGPLTSVPNGTPHITGSNPEIFNGLAAGQSVVFVEDTGIFVSGDQIVINPGGYYGPESDLQEEHTVTGMSYYEPEDCCNVTLNSSASANQSFVIHNKEDDAISAGHKIKFSGYSTLYTVESVQDQGTTEKVNFTPVLQDNLTNDHCACIIQPALLTEENLFNNYPEGTKVSRKYARTTTTYANCNSSGDVHWNNVDLLIQSNDFDGSTLISDSSQSSHAITVSGDTHHDTGTYKFADSSVEFDGVEDHLLVTGSVADFSADNFTLEFWVNTTSASRMSICGSATITVASSVDIEIGDGTWKQTRGSDVDDTGKIIAFFAHGYDGVNRHTTSYYNLIIGQTTVTDGNWHHVAVVRNGKYLYLYVDGQREGTAYDSIENEHLNANYDSSLPSETTPLNSIGTAQYSGPREYRVGALRVASYTEELTGPENLRMAFSGFLEDFRITKKIARYTSNFDVPASSFDNFICDDNVNCNSTCYDATHLYLDVGTYSGLGPSWTNGAGENQPAWDWYLTGYRDHFIDFSGINVHATGNNTHGILTLSYPDKGI
jgi:hypothetical protein